MQKRVLFVQVAFLLCFCFFSGCSPDKTIKQSPISLIQDGRVKDGAVALTRLAEDEGWELLGSLSPEMQDNIFRELITLALSHYSAGRYPESESLLTWVEEHSGGDYEALKIAQAELFLLKGETRECSETLIALVGVHDKIDAAYSAPWSQPLRDFYAANIMQNSIGLNPPVETPGIREDIYIEDVTGVAQTSVTSAGALVLKTPTVSVGQTPSVTASSKKRTRGLRYPFSGDRLSEKRLTTLAQNSYNGMSTKELISIAGKPNRVISSSLPSQGLWKGIEQTDRWDYVDDSGAKGIAVVVLNGVVKSIGFYERKVK